MVELSRSQILKTLCDTDAGDHVDVLRLQVVKEMFERLVERAGGQEEGVGGVEAFVVEAVDGLARREHLKAREGRRRRRRRQWWYWNFPVAVAARRVKSPKCCIPEILGFRFQSSILDRAYVNVAWVEYEAYDLDSNFCR